MYFYYALAALKIQRKLLGQIKLFITIIQVCRASQDDQETKAYFVPYFQISQFVAAAIGCMFRFYAMFVEQDESCYDFPVTLVLLFLLHSTTLLVLFLNYFLQEYVWKKNSKSNKRD